MKKCITKNWKLGQEIKLRNIFLHYRQFISYTLLELKQPQSRALLKIKLKSSQYK